MEFTELPLSGEVLAGIDKAGYKDCTPVQETVLPISLSGRDVMVQSKTGSGKTAVYLLTILEKYSRNKAGAALIVSPTRELAVQIEEDARRLGLLDDAPPVPKEVSSLIGSTNSQMINTLVLDIISNTDPERGMGFSDEVYGAVVEMKDYNYRNIYRSEILAGYNRYFSRLLRLIAGYLDELVQKYGFDKKGYDEEKNMLAAGFYAHLVELRASYEENKEGLDRLVLDYVAGMSDNFALDCANEILKPEHLNDRIEQSQRGKWFDA